MKINIINFFEDTSEKTPIFHMLNTNMKNQVEYFRYEAEAISCSDADMTIYIFEQPTEAICGFLEHECQTKQAFIQISAQPIEKFPYIRCEAWFGRSVDYEDMIHTLMLIMDNECIKPNESCHKELLMGRMKREWENDKVLNVMMNQCPDVTAEKLYLIHKAKINQDCYENCGCIDNVEVIKIILKGKSEYVHCGLLIDECA